MKNRLIWSSFVTTILSCFSANELQAGLFANVTARSQQGAAAQVAPADYAPASAISPQAQYGAVPIPPPSAAASAQLYGSVPIPSPSAAAVAQSEGFVSIPPPSQAARIEAEQIRQSALIKPMPAVNSQNTNSFAHSWGNLRNRVLSAGQYLTSPLPQLSQVSSSAWNRFPLRSFLGQQTNGSQNQISAGRAVAAGPEVRSSTKGFAVKADNQKPLFVKAAPNTSIIVEFAPAKPGLPAEQYIIKAGTIDPTNTFESGVSFDEVWNTSSSVSQTTSLSDTPPQQYQNEAPPPSEEAAPPPPFEEAAPPPPSEEAAPPPPSEEAAPPPSEEAAPPPSEEAAPPPPEEEAPPPPPF